MKLWRTQEITTVEENLGALIGPAIQEGNEKGYELVDIKYSTSYDHGWRRVRSCALILMSKEEKEGADE